MLKASLCAVTLTLWLVTPAPSDAGPLAQPDLRPFLDIQANTSGTDSPTPVLVQVNWPAPQLGGRRRR